MNWQRTGRRGNQVRSAGRAQRTNEAKQTAGRASSARRNGNGRRWKHGSKPRCRKSNLIYGPIRRPDTISRENGCGDNTEGPVSLSALRGAEALNNTHQSLVTLMMVTTAGNDRPITGFPRFSNDSDMPYLRKVQSLLIEFGPLMVEKEMLAE